MRTGRQCFFDAVRDAKDILCDYYPYVDWETQYGEGFLYDISSYDISDVLFDEASYDIEEALKDYSMTSDVEYLFDVFSHTVEELALKY